MMWKRSDDARIRQAQSVCAGRPPSALSSTGHIHDTLTAAATTRLADTAFHRLATGLAPRFFVLAVTRACGVIHQLSSDEVIKALSLQSMFA